MYAGFLDLTQPLYFTIDDVLSPEECRAYVARFERTQAEIGTIIGVEGEVVDLETRNNTRVMWDDHAEAHALFLKIAPKLPAMLRGMQIETANPRLRLYRYGPGEKHGAHWDTEVELDHGRRTLLTFVVYLNDDFEGGETEFPELRAIVTPKRGRALLFQHRVVHIASEVQRGAKYVLRTDVVYR
jgi:prolyl 4-hydroxylase